MEQPALNYCDRVSLACEGRRWQRVSVVLPALSPGADSCRCILNRRYCALSLRLPAATTGPLASLRWSRVGQESVLAVRRLLRLKQPNGSTVSD